MSTPEISLTCEPKTELKGMPLITEVIDPEIAKFEQWFAHPDHGNSSLTKMEKEVLRSYLYQKLTGTL